MPGIRHDLALPYGYFEITQLVDSLRRVGCLHSRRVFPALLVHYTAEPAGIEPASLLAILSLWMCVEGVCYSSSFAISWNTTKLGSESDYFGSTVSNLAAVVPLHSLNGQSGIRTHVTVSRKQHFQCCSFNHSDTCPFIRFSPMYESPFPWQFQ